MNGRRFSNDHREHTHGNSLNRLSFSSAHSGSTAATLTSASNAEQNHTESYAGATFETVPSSIVSFHHPHSFQSGSVLGGSLASSTLRRGRRSTEEEALLDSAANYSRSPSRNPHFRLFTEDQIAAAEGAASTLEATDYDMNWDSTPAYEQQRLEESRLSSTRNSLHSNSVRSSNFSGISYDSIGERRRGRSLSRSRQLHPEQSVHSSVRSSSNSSRYSTRDRIPSELEDNGDEMLNDRSTNGSLPMSAREGFSENDGDNASGIADSHANGHHKKAIYHAEFLQPCHHEKFYPNLPAKLYYQRFYVAEEDLVIGIGGYRTSKFRLYIYYMLCLCTLGMVYLLLRWIPYYKVKLYGVKVPLGKAEWVVLESELGDFNIVAVKREWYNRPMSTVLPITKELADDNAADSSSSHHANGSNPNIPILISFDYRYITFIYSPLEDIFRSNNNWTDVNWVDLPSVYRGLTSGTCEDRTLAFGRNNINLKVKPTSQVLFDEALHPFYVFQLFSIVLWSLDQYYYYAACILLISFLSIIDTLIETKRTSQRLAEMSHFNCEVRVLREEFWTHISSAELVPGDVYEVSDPALTVFPCDSILLSGDCIVNESMLTGESVPVSKVPANEDTMYQLLDDFKDTQISNYLSKSFLFNGTKIIRTRIPKAQSAALAMVVRTGFSTTKGSLIRSMVFPKPTNFKFYEDSFKYIGFMTMIALFGFSISCIRFIQIGLDKKTMILRALDIITVVVPPALPATLTIGTNFALGRLKNRNIFCISPTKVNAGGKLDVMCFDKTGTLTEDGLDILGVHVSEPSSHNSFAFGELQHSVRQIFPKFSLNDCSSPMDFRARNFFIALLTCHSLRLVDNELIGDPLDFKMFQFTGWSYEEDFQEHAFHSLYDKRHEGDIFPENSDIIPAVVHPNGNEPHNRFTDNDPHNFLGIVRSFEFLSKLRRMSVIVKPSSDNVFWAFTKGAPEVISEICNKSTLPKNYDELLHHYTRTGYRVIACAGKTLPKRTWLYSQKVTREEVETNLEFLGFIIFENKVKDATSKTLQILREANIRTIMCTGDNVLTAISVGRESHLIESPKVYVSSINEEADVEDPFPVWRSVDCYEETLDLDEPQFSTSTGDYTLAVTGDIFRSLFDNDEKISESYRDRVLLKASIYARMSPDEKHELMERLQKLDYVVGFCGDGANDCGALKAADVGISLSEAEASVAAPFTSQVFDISCVLDVIKEGRASLVTSLACFQYMSLYSAIQFISITILYCRGSNLGDFQFLFIDLLLIIPIAVFMSWSKPYHKIARKRPSANLVSPKILVPLCFSILICLSFQAIPWLLVQRTPWYIKPIVGGDDAVQSSDNTVLFFVSNFQYILCAVVLSVGPPYREPMSKNVGFIVDVILSLFFSTILMFINPDSRLGSLFQLTGIATGFKVFILVWALLNYLCQLYVPTYFKSLFKKNHSSKKYKSILKKQNMSLLA